MRKQAFCIHVCENKTQISFPSFQYILFLFKYTETFKTAISTEGYGYGSIRLQRLVSFRYNLLSLSCIEMHILCRKIKYDPLTIEVYMIF